MDSRALLTDAFHRIPALVRRHAAGADDYLLHTRLDPEANSLAWLLWHTTRQQDVQVAEILEHEQVWTAQGWSDRFALELAVDDHGYGHDSEQVASVRVGDPELLAGYQDDVTAMIDLCIAGLDADELDRVIDRDYEPPVTVGIRLISILGDAFQHLGQAGYLRGVLERQR